MKRMPSAKQNWIDPTRVCLANKERTAGIVSLMRSQQDFRAGILFQANQTSGELGLDNMRDSAQSVE
jgi:hypothetical protein